MNDHLMHTHEVHESSPTHQRARWAFWAFLALAGGYLLAEHRAHVANAWPFLIILVCPLLHMFMHGGHGGHGRNDRSAGNDGRNQGAP